MAAHLPSRSVYRNTAIVLFVLLVATMVVSAVRLGVFAPVVALGIALAKAILVALVFMHLNRASRLARLFAIAGLFWFVILLALTLADYMTRSPSAS